MNPELNQPSRSNTGTASVPEPLSATQQPYQNLEAEAFSNSLRSISPQEPSAAEIGAGGASPQASHQEHKSARSPRRGIVQMFRELFKHVEGEGAVARAKRLICQTALIVCAEIIVSVPLAAALQAVGVRFGNAGADKLEALSKTAPGVMLVSACIVGPIVEEAIFRLLPSKLLDFANSLRRKPESKNPAWSTGLVASALFAAAHGLSAIPIPQFLSGLFFWRTMRNYGYWGAVFCHAAQNGILLGVGYLLARGGL